VWFALNDDRPLFAFAGVWTEFRGDRGAKSRPDPRPSPSLRIPDDLAERGG
jgi:putative SOS response-associated peptidase YedK